MPEANINLRRQFRNRFEVYADFGCSTAAAELDGSALTLPDLCLLLRQDMEPFPRHYNEDLRRIVARTGSGPIAMPRTYGEVAKLISIQLAETASIASTPLADRH